MVGINRPKALILEINQSASAHSINWTISKLRFDFHDVIKSIKRSDDLVPVEKEKINWHDMINKIIITELTDHELAAAKVIHLSPNKKAVQLDYANDVERKNHQQILCWEYIDKCSIIDILE